MRIGWEVINAAASFAACFSLVMTATNACAQDGPPADVDTTYVAGPAGPPKTVFDDTWVSVGAGAGYRPSYEGSDDYNISPAPFIQGSVDGFNFGARGPGLFVDVIRDSGRTQGQEKKIQLVLGPQIMFRFDRTSRIKDPVVSLLGERDTGVELGFTSGIAIKKLANPFDTLTVSLNAGWDVAGAHDGSIISPSVSYSTPLSRAAFVNLSLSADRVDDNFAHTYYTIDAAASTASGLPTFNADGGWKSAGAFLIGAYDLSGNALDGGFSLFGLSSYSRLLGDAKRSPITSIRGSADQFFVGGGIAYSF
jgi:MipA family protein